MPITLADGASIPRIGLGTWPMDDAEAEHVVAEAIDLGYRLVDTAYAYGNEVGVGRGVRASSAAREDVFITTKFNHHSHGVGGVAQAWADSARKLDVDYLDLLLIHWPNPWQDRYVEAWEGLIALHEQGKVRHLGVSNFLPEHLDRIIEATGVTPVFNQLQINPRYLQREARAYDDAHGIHTQSWSPLGQDTGLLDLPLLGEVADVYGCTRGQLVLAWHLAHGLSVVAKSSRRERLIENLAAGDVVLDPRDVDRIDGLDGTEPDIKHPNSFGH